MIASLTGLAEAAWEVVSRLLFAGWVRIPTELIQAQKVLLLYFPLLLLPALVAWRPARRWLNLATGLALAWLLWGAEYCLLLVAGNLLVERLVRLAAGRSAGRSRQATAWGLMAAVTLLYFSLLGGVPLTKAITVPVIHWAGIAYLYPRVISHIADGLLRNRPLPSTIAYLEWLFFFPTFQQGPIEQCRTFGELGRPLAGRGVRYAATAGLRLALFLWITRLDLSAHAWYAGAGLTARFWIETWRLTLNGFLAFSAYSDTAVALAAFQGITLVDNFQNPYLASSPSLFWRRYHVSLSRWLREQIYIPLGGNRRRVHLNIWATFLFCGLWHGVAWNFVLWGAWHATLVSADRWLRSRVAGRPDGLLSRFANGSPRLTAGLGWLTTVQCVAAGWNLFFHPVGEALFILRQLAGLGGS